MRKPVQLEMNTNTHGGARKGAGRKPNDQGLVPHVTRAKVTRHTPVHLTVKLVPRLMNLRSKKILALFKIAAQYSAQRGLHINHFTLQHDHVHLLAEVGNNENLARGMQSFCIAFAKGLNRLLGRKGTVFKSRYHLHVLKSPREVRNILSYIFTNAAKHLKRKIHYDVFSSASLFFEWELLGIKLHRRPPEPDWELRDILPRPKSWLLTSGWYEKMDSR